MEYLITFAGLEQRHFVDCVFCVVDLDPDPYVFGPPGSGSVGQRYGSGFFYRQAKTVRKTLIPTVSVFCHFFMSYDFLSWHKIGLNESPK
jgi:hypothetical protein